MRVGSRKSNGSTDESRPQRQPAGRRSPGGPPDRPGAGPAAPWSGADRQRELRQPRRDRRHGHAAHQQVRGGLPRPPLLRRLRGHRRDRAARHRPTEAALRRGARQRPAALRGPGQLRRLHGVDPARREDHGHGAAARWAPEPRRGGQPQRGRSGRRCTTAWIPPPAGSTTTRSASRPSGSGPSSSSQAAAPTPGSSTSPPSDRSRTRSARCFWWTWRTSPAWWRAASIPRRCRTRRWSPAPPTRRCAGLVPGSSSAPRE